MDRSCHSGRWEALKEMMPDGPLESRPAAGEGVGRVAEA
jgi:hypothetical protein